MGAGELWKDAGVEPTVAELLADVPARAILRYDRLTPEQVLTVVDEVRDRLTLNTIGPKKPGRVAA